jgi:hypothetical protein
VNDDEAAKLQGLNPPINTKSKSFNPSPYPKTQSQKSVNELKLITKIERKA